MRVVVFGCLPVASKILELVDNIEDLSVVGVSINNYSPNLYDPFLEYPFLNQFADQRGIPHMSHDQLASDPLGFDLGIAVRYSKFISKDIIDKFSIGIVNFHPGILPEYAGLLTEVHALLNNESHAGATLHWINEKIDRGPIVSTKAFLLSGLDTALSVYQRTSLAMYDLAEDFLSRNLFLQPDYHPIENDTSRFGYYNRFSIDGKKDISKFVENGDIDEISLRARAFYFPGHEPAFYIDNYGNKQYIVPCGFSFGARGVSPEEAYSFTQSICRMQSV